MTNLGKTWLVRARRRLSWVLRGKTGRSRAISRGSSAPTSPQLEDIEVLRRLSDFSEYQEELPAIMAERKEQIHREEEIQRQARQFFVSGVCYVCAAAVDFLVDYRYSAPLEVEERVPNWRERLVCPSCGLNNRMRATIHLFEALVDPKPGCSIYIAEQTTLLYQAFVHRYDNVTGSEFLGNRVPFGTEDKRGIRNEDLTNLSLADESFDFAVSLDVFEHVPDFSQALVECCRVLRENGKLFVTVPFRIDLENNLVRASIREDGSVEHILEPEYHGDPLSKEGCLAFYHFGWDFLDQLKAAGFASAYAYLYWSEKFGYLGGAHVFFVASK